MKNALRVFAVPPLLLASIGDWKRTMQKSALERLRDSQADMTLPGCGNDCA